MTLLLGPVAQLRAPHRLGSIRFREDIEEY